MATDLSAIRSLARRLYVDTDSTDPALSDADLTALINEAYYKWHEAVDPRYKTGTLFAVSGSSMTATSSAANIVEIGSVYAGVVGSTFRTIEQVPYNYIQEKISEDGTTTSDAPSMCNIQRTQTDTEASINLWLITVWPKSAAGYNVNGVYRVTPAALSGATDEPDMSEEARYVLARIVAARAAYIVGEDSEFIAQILAPVPEQVQSAMGLAELANRPKPRAGGRVG